MKKLTYLIAITLGAVLASCSSDAELGERAEEELLTPISFLSFTKKATRGVEATRAQKLEDYHTTFAVYGYKYIQGVEQAPVFDNVKVTFKPSTEPDKEGFWEYSPITYWDKDADGGYSFFAVAPYRVSDDARFNWKWDAVNKKFSISGFAVSSKSLDPSPEISNGAVFSVDNDLMVSTDIIGYKDFSSNDVNLSFNHVLTRINIGVRKDQAMEADEVVLKSLTLHNTYCQGDYDEARGDGEGRTTSSWNGLDKVQTEGIGYSQETAITTSFNYVYQALFIPQTVAYAYCPLNGYGLNAQSAAYLHIVYTVNGETFSSYYNLADIFNGNEETDFTFGEGWQTTLRININSSEYRINFDAHAYEWATQSQDFDIY